MFTPMLTSCSFSCDCGCSECVSARCAICRNFNQPSKGTELTYQMRHRTDVDHSFAFPPIPSFYSSHPFFPSFLPSFLPSFIHSFLFSSSFSVLGLCFLIIGSDFHPCKRVPPELLANHLRHVYADTGWKSSLPAWPHRPRQCSLRSLRNADRPLKLHAGLCWS